MPQKIIAGNWKMYKTIPQAIELANGLKKRLQEKPASKSLVVVCPPFTNLQSVHSELKNTGVEIGAQNIYGEKEGAYTGEISAAMVKSSGAGWVILGHSERRRYFKEDEAVINNKIKIALKEGLKVIFCVGETLEEREQGLTMDIVSNQVEWGLKDLNEVDLRKLAIAYEPVWAIGTGKTATPEQAQEIHAFIRDILGALKNSTVGKNISVLYGGSMKPENAEGLLSQPDIDGGLVGGACLKAESFHKIIMAGEKVF
jgi:triosephosphate isomerase